MSMMLLLDSVLVSKNGVRIEFVVVALSCFGLSLGTFFEIVEAEIWMYCIVMVC